MLLYNETDEMIQLDNTYWKSGNRISVKTLDLNQRFCDRGAFIRNRSGVL